MLRWFLIAATSFLLGSIPFGYLLVRLFRGEDVRKSGSGNIGATNVSRKSPTLGGFTLLLDALKGAVAVSLAIAASSGNFVHLSIPHIPGRALTSSAPNPVIFASLAALFAVVGHVFPVWLRFRGGKGVATGLGAFVMIAPKAVLLAAAIFIALVLAFRYVSLGSIVAVAVFPLLTLFLHEFGDARVALALMSLTSLLIVAKHHENLRRLWAGTENRFGRKPA